ncbi:putative integral membrane protein [Rosellinia necatrix]|uniref:Putative integral membrane protein n=1 Tax=Rosellinia necatrix TaxID=77044 RepID=A0A1W2TBK8_ROSNE|nr:putative integral membrane protein [Rosellinia necatrix]
MMDLGPLGQGLEWQYNHRHETRVPELVIACTSTAVASIIIIALRVVSRRLLHHRLYLDASDWLVFVAWVFFAAINVSWAVGTMYGIGQHAVAVANIHIVQILVLVSDAAYVLAVTFTKFSVLALYLKAFSTPNLRYCIWGTVVLVAGWGMSGVVVAIFQCASVDYVWRSGVQEVCINLDIWYLTSGIINTITSIIILAMVFPFAWGLLTTKHGKWRVLVALVVGSSACIISIVRLPYSIRASTDDETWDAIPAAIFSVVEITVGMLAISMPTYLPLCEHVFRGGMCGHRIKTHPYNYKENLHMDFYGGDMQNDVNVTSPGTHMGADCGGINVTNHIELVRHTNKSGNWVRVTDEDEEELCTSEEQSQPREPRNNVPC